MTDSPTPTLPATSALLAPRPYSPQSPMANEPPAKRPRLSPGLPGSHSYSSPQLLHYAHPDLPQSPYSSFNSPQPLRPLVTDAMSTPPAGTMGPPERPKADKAMDINFLNDNVAVAGVDLKEEENYLSSAYRNQHGTQGSATAVNSFGSVGSWNSLSPENTFASWSQSPTATQLSQAGRPVGPLSQPPVTPHMMEETIKAKHKEAARRQAEKQQVHLRDPFLLANVVLEKIRKKGVDAGVRVRDDTVRIANGGDPNDLQVGGQRWQLQNGGTLIAANTTVVSADSTLPNILALLSLATQQRTRGLLEDAYTSSRSRQYGSGGKVPPEWLDLAIGKGPSEKTTIRPESVSRTSWDAVPDSAVSPMTVIPAKRVHDESEGIHNPLTPPPDPEPTVLPTIRYPSELPSLLQKLGKEELEREKARLELRKKRKENKEKRNQEPTTSSSEAPVNGLTTPEKTKPSTPTAPIEAKLSKKDRDKQAKNQTEEVLQRNANETANLQLGGFSSKYSWMNSAAKSSSSITTGAGMREKLAGTRKPSTSKPVAEQENVGLEANHSYKQLGLLKEGHEILMRDFVNVLERDGKEKKSLVKGYARLGTEKPTLSS